MAWFAIPYTLVFLVIASQVLLVLFIGVISTSMDEARVANALEKDEDMDLLKLKKERGLTTAQIHAFRGIFNSIDLEKDNELSPAEVEDALGLLELDITPEEMKVIFKKLDPEMKGIHLSNFIKMVLMTPKYKASASTQYITQLLKKNKKEIRKTKFDWSKMFHSGPSAEEIVEAVILVQRFYRNRKRLRMLAALEAQEAAATEA